MACEVKNSFTRSINSYWAPLSEYQVLNLRGVAPAVSAYRAAGKHKYTGTKILCQPRTPVYSKSGKLANGLFLSPSEAACAALGGGCPQQKPGRSATLFSAQDPPCRNLGTAAHKMIPAKCTVCTSAPCLHHTLQ